MTSATKQPETSTVTVTGAARVTDSRRTSEYYLVPAGEGHSAALLLLHRF